MNAAVLVIGGAGYIGSHMVKMLTDDGFDVTVFDNLSLGHRDAVLSGTFVKGDLIHKDDLETLFRHKKFDVVMHFAAFCYVGESMTEPLKYYRNNVAGTLNLLHAMKENGVNKFVFSSSCATYGIPKELPLSESHEQRPINPYGSTKLFVERILADCATAHGLKSIALRYFNAAGCDPEGALGERHGPETHLIPLVLMEALRIERGGDPKETTLCVYGDDFDTRDGTCIRDYIHVQDLCNAHLLAAERLMKGEVAGFEAYNLGNGTGFSVKEVIDVSRKVTGLPIEYRIAARRPGDPSQLVGSGEKAKAVLGWQPQFGKLEKIIETAWRWFEKN
jgi:UDP-glucose 4-epimerase